MDGPGRPTLHSCTFMLFPEFVRGVGEVLYPYSGKEVVSAFYVSYTMSMGWVRLDGGDGGSMAVDKLYILDHDDTGHVYIGSV